MSVIIVSVGNVSYLIHGRYCVLTCRWVSVYQLLKSRVIAAGAVAGDAARRRRRVRVGRQPGGGAARARAVRAAPRRQPRGVRRHHRAGGRAAAGPQVPLAFFL